MAKWVHSDVQDGTLSAVRASAIKMLLISGYTAGDSYATVLGKKVAEVTMASGDFTLSTSGTSRVLTTASGKSAIATGTTNQYDAGTASGGTSGSLTDSSKSWTTNAHAGRAVTITGGTGSGQTGTIASNTGTALTLSGTWAVSPDATSTYRISDNTHYAFTDGSAKVLWVTDETSNQVVTAGNAVGFPSVTLTNTPPV